MVGIRVEAVRGLVVMEAVKWRSAGFEMIVMIMV